MSPRIARVLCVAASAWLGLAGLALAQQRVDTSVIEQVRQAEQRARTDLAPTTDYLKVTGADRVLDGWGAWFTNTIIDFSDDDKNARTLDALQWLDLTDLRLWYTTQVGRKLTAYFRLRTQNFDFDVTVPAARPDFVQLERVDLDLGFFDYKIDNLNRVRGGRQYTQTGRGFVLADTLDGLSFNHIFDKKLSGLTLQAFYGTTPNRSLNVDTSIVGFSKGLTHRDFGGIEFDYTHHAGNHYYAYFLDQVDHSQSESPTQAAVDFHYNSNYTGAGAEVRVSPRVLSLTEFGFEGGSTLSDAGGRVGVSASFFETLALWNMKGLNQPLLQAEYAYGSGDDMRGNVTNTFGGKQDLTRDSGFNYFGRFETGVALSPRLSNIHIGRVAFQQRIRWHGRHVDPKDPLIGFKINEYYKDHIAGAISDPLATANGKHVGDGVDVYLAWRVWSDTVLNAQMGHFKPGNAYPIGARSASDRYVLSTTLSF